MPFHPLLISFYAVLSLYSENISEVLINVIVRPLIVIVLCTGILYLLFRILTNDWQKSGLLLSFFLLLFLTYGHFHTFKDISIGGINVFRHKYLIVIWLILGITGTTFIYRVKHLDIFTNFANTMSVVLLLFPLLNIGRYVYEEKAYSSVIETQASTQFELSISPPFPDVYFVVLDAYGREDVLRDLFEFDNSGFIRELQDMGFYVVQCSQSNYANTQLSIASTLNMDYIDNLVPDLYADEVKYWVAPLLNDSRVRNVFEGLGYEIIAFYNDFPRLQWQDADYFLRPDEQSSQMVQLGSKLTSFEEMLINTTLLSPVIDLQMDETQISSNPSRREASLYLLDTLPKIPKILDPKFTYAHLMLPHPPFIFGPNGEEVNNGFNNNGTHYEEQAYRIGYRDQLIYVNQSMVLIFREIIEKSPTPPIIIVESDHGPTAYGGAQNRMRNFMAYYFPDKNAASLVYPSITPVNTFRLVFNEYFNGKYSYLDDVSYYSDATHNLSYEIVVNTCV